MKKLLILLSIIYLQSCKSDLTKSNIVEDTATVVVVVKNGKNLDDTIDYTCTGCKSLLTPDLSFIPISQEITILKLDSLNK